MDNEIKIILNKINIKDIDNALKIIYTIDDYIFYIKNTNTIFDNPILESGLNNILLNKKGKINILENILISDLDNIHPLLNHNDFKNIKNIKILYNLIIFIQEFNLLIDNTEDNNFNKYIIPETEVIYKCLICNNKLILSNIQNNLIKYICVNNNKHIFSIDEIEKMKI